MSTTKDYILERSFNIFKIKLEGGGQLSKELSGDYSSVREAEIAIQDYESKKKPSRKAQRGVVNGETESTT